MGSDFGFLGTVGKDSWPQHAVLWDISSAALSMHFRAKASRELHKQLFARIWNTGRTCRTHTRKKPRVPWTFRSDAVLWDSGAEFAGLGAPAAGGKLLQAIGLHNNLLREMVLHKPAGKQLALA